VENRLCRRRTRRRVPLFLLALLLICALLVGACGLVRLVSAPAASAPPVSLARDLYTGFIFRPKAGVDAGGYLWIGGFIFRSTRERRLPGDVAVAAVAVECRYSPTDFERLFNAPDSLVTFSAIEGPDGNLELTSCPVDARPAGNIDIEASQ
jgi:hypothetical protein